MKHELKSILVEPFATEEEKAHFVAEQDALLESRMGKVADRIASHADLKLIGLTGPTCAGKTTAARKLTQTLKKCGRRVHVVSIDDFYYEKSYLDARSGVHASTELDYDSEDTIDIGLLQETVERLLSCQATQLPKFNFKNGCREEGEHIAPTEEDVFLFEGIQILYPKVYSLLHGDRYRSIYICPLSAIHAGDEIFLPNEIRLMRRLVRDQLHRSSAVDFTLRLWQSVRKNEELHIFPHVSLCDEFLDSTMAYDVGMLKPFLDALLTGYSQDDPFAAQAEQILKKLERVQPISHAYIAQNSLYKEFI